jgi:hypothetical protein
MRAHITAIEIAFGLLAIWAVVGLKSLTLWRLPRIIFAGTAYAT